MFIAIPNKTLSVSNGSCDSAAWCRATQLDEPSVPDELAGLEEVFSEELSDSLNTHEQVEHLIDLLPSKLPRSSPIYKISYDKLAAIRDYLSTALKKKWIRPLSS